MLSSHLLEFYVVGIAVILLLVECFFNLKNKSILALIGAAALVPILYFVSIAPCCCCEVCETSPVWLSRFYTIDCLASFFKVIALISTILVLLLSFDYKKVLNRFSSTDNSDSNIGEYYILPLFTCAGLMWMASARDLVSIFVSLELVTISFYILVAYMRRNIGSLEAGVKYLILGALSTGFLVYGIAWLYGATGTTHLPTMAAGLGLDSTCALTDKVQTIAASPTLFFGLALIILALGFKVGAVPMQLWIPDVYQGAPTPTTAYLSVASKAAGFGIAIAILKPFLAAPQTQEQVTLILVILAAATLLYGNLAALSQANFKRLLAYSSIAHAGFLLMGMATGSYTHVGFYLVTYLIMTFAAFYILALVSAQTGSDAIDSLDGMAKRNPVLALVTTIVMAAMAGVPLTAGFLGKFLIFSSAVGNLSWIVIAIAFVGVAAGFYYYFKIIRAIYWHAPQDETPLETPFITKTVLTVLTVFIILFGIYPLPLQRLFQSW